MPSYFQGLSDRRNGTVHEAVRRREQSAVARGQRPPSNPVVTIRGEPVIPHVVLDLETWSPGMALERGLTATDFVELERRITEHGRFTGRVETPLYSGDDSRNNRDIRRTPTGRVSFPDSWGRPSDQAINRRARRFVSEFHRSSIEAMDAQLYAHLDRKLRINSEKSKSKSKPKEDPQMSFKFPLPQFVPAGEMQPKDFAVKMTDEQSWSRDSVYINWRGPRFLHQVEVTNSELNNPEEILMKYNAVMAYKRQKEEKKNVRT